MGLFRKFVSQTQKYPDSKLTAIDYSDVSLEKTRDYNADLISKGRCEVERGDVSALKYHEQYDLQ